MEYKISFEPVGRRYRCADTKSLLECSRQVGVGIASTCGGDGWCGTCKIRILEGKASLPTSEEKEALSGKELEEGWRLACQIYPASDCKVYVPPESMTTTQRLQVEGVEAMVSPEPLVSAYQVKLSEPSLSDLQADAERFLSALEQQHKIHCARVDIDVLRNLSPSLRSMDWQVQASVRDDEIVAVAPWPSRRLGLAVDLGSTKIASYLVDLDSGITLASQGVMNPQISYGEDIVSRITHVIKQPTENRRLQEVVVEALNLLVAELCAKAEVEKSEIIEAVVVGNTAMHHLLLCLPVKQLAYAPYVPAIRDSLDVKARDIGLNIAHGAYVHLLPNIAGFVGADHVAMLLATDAWQAEELTVAIDIGTNTEVSLIDNGGITSISCASGPAFEGGHIRDGMRASSGAIERVRLKNGEIQYETIEGAPPVGICGSGILDIMAQLYLNELVNSGGRMVDDHPRVRTVDERREFVLVSDKEQDSESAIVFSQQDVRELQLAKGAIRSGIEVLLQSKGRPIEDIKQVIIAGAFGTYIDVSSAVTIGMFPMLPIDRFHQVGNAAGIGAKLALISRDKRNQAGAIASKADYIEQATDPKFTEIFMQATSLGEFKIVQ